MLVIKLYLSSILVLVCCQVGKDNVHLALSLVGYDEEIQAAMAYVFGTTFICDSMDNAKKVLTLCCLLSELNVCWTVWKYVLGFSKPEYILLILAAAT